MWLEDGYLRVMNEEQKLFRRKTVLIMKIWIMVDLALVIVCWASV
ncbi:hypothetical protein ALTERO38_50060 [Alteromonas sp. 38]|nr:hypothetical protein ALTER154_90172 [Alteromonas sp. 154]VXB18574.1 hypothetical protein ALTERO38_50060 [Alteromonas sp. 38]